MARASFSHLITSYAVRIMTDVVIVGGGIAGMSACAQLAPYFKVVLLEAEPELCYHSSGRSAATFIEDYGNRVTKELNKASLTFLKSESQGFLKKRGLLLLGKKGEEAQFQTDSEDLGLKYISVNEAFDFIPVLNRESITRQAYRPDVYDIDTHKLYEHYRKSALKHGAQIRKKTKLKAAYQKNKKWEIKSSDGDISTSALVNAAGAWADQVAEFCGVSKLNIKPFKRSIARMQTPAGINVQNWPMIDGVGETWYAKPDTGSLIISPADKKLVEPHDAWADDETLAAGVESFQDIINAPIERMLSNWAGLRSFAPDENLVIGPDKNNPSFFWFAGQGGYGFQTAAAASQLLCDLFLERKVSVEDEILQALLPGRF